MDNNNNNSKSDWSKRDVGALWKRESATQKYLSGYVKVDELGIERELKVVVFSNKNKKDNPKAPDYRVYLSVPQDKNNAPSASSQVKEDKKAPVKPAKAVSAASNNLNNENALDEEDVL
jgi:uncharacterized protein (DUF736 family)